MECLEQVRQWLAGFPGWEGTIPVVDCLGAAPGEVGLFPKGVELLRLSKDVLGTVKRHLRCSFLIRWVCPISGMTDADKALALQSWVALQSEAGLAPSLGENTRWFAGQGRLDGTKGPGTGVYAVTVSAEFTKIYE